MFPFVFEWTWTFDRLLFMGAFGYVLTIIGLGIGFCVVKSVIDTFGEKEGGGHGDH